MSTNIEQTPIPATKMLQVVQSLETFVGKIVVDDLINNLAKVGVDLRNQNRSYFFRELQAGLNHTFGNSAAGLMMRKIKHDLSQN